MPDTKKGKGPNRPPTKTMEPPPRKQPEQLPADDGGGTEGQEPEQSSKVDEEAQRRNKPIEQESRSDENDGCGG